MLGSRDEWRKDRCKRTLESEEGRTNEKHGGEADREPEYEFPGGCVVSNAFSRNRLVSGGTHGLQIQYTYG